MELNGEARPHIIRVADQAVTLTPRACDEITCSAIKAKYPRQLAAQHRTADDVKADALLSTTKLILAQYPHLPTTVARLAAQQSYLDWRERP